MKYWTAILLSFLTIGAAAQVRSYAEMDSKTFVIGLDSYFYGASGALDVTCEGKTVSAIIAASKVSIEGQTLLQSSGDVLVGVHDFTGDHSDELVVGVRSGDALAAYIYQYKGGKWALLGKIGAAGSGISEIRVFRQALTIKDKTSGALHTWTCHGGKFDFKSSGGGSDPTPSNL